MRISDDRYSRDVKKHALALRLMEHEARTQTICDWTGLTYERVRNLCQTHASSEGQHQAARHRGPSPRRLTFFLRSAHMRSEASAIAGLCRVFEVIPLKTIANARRDLPSVARGERLCLAFEMYRRLMPDSEVTLEHFVLLATALAQGSEIEMTECADCGAVIVMERFTPARRRCQHCQQFSEQQSDEDELPALSSTPAVQQQSPL